MDDSDRGSASLILTQQASQSTVDKRGNCRSAEHSKGTSQEDPIVTRVKIFCGSVAILMKLHSGDGGSS